jgi:hypothetical protein
MKLNIAWILVIALGLLVFVVACEDDDEVDTSIGSACSCEGEACTITMGDDTRPMPAPDPLEVTFVDCEPDTTTGATTSCFLSYEGNLGTTTYYQDGYCALSSTSCENNPTLCPTAEYGDYEAHVACPAGTVMLRTTTEVADPVAMTIHSKICVASCATDADCRTGYDCIDKDGVMFCYDDRNLSGDYEAEQF